MGKEEKKMTKIAMPVSNNYCPQTMFLYGTYREDGTPNFGLFCWFSYCWNGQLSVMACIGEEKLTKDRIRATGVFSANLVTSEELPLADRLGTTSGYDEAKRALIPATTRGRKLAVPLLDASPWSYELEVAQTVALDGSEVYICHIRNIMGDAALADEGVPLADRVARVDPACTTFTTCFDFHGNRLGDWGDFSKR